MPKKIVLPAHFSVCENCGLHGHIIFSDGSEGKEIASESEALLQLEQAKKEGKLLDIEIQVLKKQIFDSTLPPTPVPTILNAIMSMMSDICEHEQDPVSRRTSMMDRVHLN